MKNSSVTGLSGEISLSGQNGMLTMVTKTIPVSGNLEILLEELEARRVYYHLTGKVISGRFDGILEMKARTPEQLGGFDEY